MKYIKTKYSTNWPKKRSLKEKLINRLLFFIPKANPDNDKKMYLVKSWLIEFLDTEGELLPWREIALDENERPVFTAPNDRNYGFWNDTNMKFENFEGTSIEKSEFEKYWQMIEIKDP